MNGYHDAYHTLLIIIAACIILANSYALSLFMRNQSLMSKTNIMLLSLALSEFMTGAVNIPLLVHAETMNGQHPTESMTLVITADISTILCATVTVITLCGIIVDRYLVICFPMKYYSLITKRKTVIFIVVSWILPLIVSFIRLKWLGPILDLSIKPATNDTNAMAITKEAYSYDKYFYVLGSSMYLLIIAVLFTLFVLMFMAIRRLGKDEREFTVSDRNSAATVKRERKAVILFAVMFVAFILCWTPLVVFRLMVSVFPIYYSKIPQSALHTLIIMKYLTSVLNPLLYILYKYDFYQEFKKDVKMLEHCCGCTILGLKKRRKSRRHTEVSFFASSAYPGESPKNKLIHGNGYHERICDDTTNI